MPKFTVIVTRDTTESCQIEVEAEDRAEAEERALETSKSGDVTWEPDDTPNASADHYVTGCDEAAPAPTYPYTPDRCPTKHWNGGDDVCADCGVGLQ